MSCAKYDTRNVGERHVTLKFVGQELIYDINNCAYVEGHLIPEGNENQRHVVIAIGQDGNIDRVNRILGVVHAATVEMLYPFTKAPIAEGSEVDDHIWPTDGYVIDLAVPSTMSQTTINLLSKLIHEYMVCMVLADWLSISKPEAAENWRLKATTIRDEINRLKSHRRGRLRRKQSMF